MTMTSRFRALYWSTLLLPAVAWAQAAGQPNFLILLTDDQRWDTLGSYREGNPIETPHIDRLANEGVRFENGFVTTPICVASRASILTGRYASNARVHQFQTRMPDDVFERTYNMLLEEAGYFTGQLGKYGVKITQEQQGRHSFWDAQEGQGPKFREYQGRTLHDSEWLTVRTEDFLDALPEGRPFALQVNYKAPHGTSCPAPEDEGALADVYFERHPKDTDEMAERVPAFVRTSFLEVCYRQEFNDGVDDHNPFVREYFEKIMSVERSVGHIVALLEERGLADNTVIIFLSDHGVHFGEKQLYGKWTPFDASLRVPFIVYDPRPGAARGAVRDEMVLNIDIAPTLMDLAGLPVPEYMDGRSMHPLIEEASQTADLEWRDHFFFEHFTSPARVKYIPRNEGIRTATGKYVHWIDPQCDEEEFYDLVRDPEEVDNLIDDPEMAPRVARLRGIFGEWRTSNPRNYNYDVYEGHRPQSLAPEIDWERFAASRPEEFERIREQVERLGVTWEQAMDDWEIRYKISSHAGYWY